MNLTLFYILSLLSLISAYSSTLNQEKVHLIVAQNLDDFNSCPEPKFLVLFSIQSCGYCKKMKNYIKNNSWSPKNPVFIYEIPSDNRDDPLVHFLIHKFPVYGYPKMLLLDKQLNKYDEVEGYNQYGLDSLIMKHFN